MQRCRPFCRISHFCVFFFLFRIYNVLLFEYFSVSHFRRRRHQCHRIYRRCCSVDSSYMFVVWRINAFFSSSILSIALDRRTCTLQNQMKKYHLNDFATTTTKKRKRAKHIKYGVFHVPSFQTLCHRHTHLHW